MVVPAAMRNAPPPMSLPTAETADRHGAHAPDRHTGVSRTPATRFCEPVTAARDGASGCAQPGIRDRTRCGGFARMVGNGLGALVGGARPDRKEAAMFALRGLFVLAAVIVTLGTAPVLAVVGGAQHRDAPRLDGFTLGGLPEGIGRHVSDHGYEWHRVAFRSRVWERGPDGDGAYHVDLTVAILRGAPLSDAEHLRAFLADYHERDPASWRSAEFGGAPGFIGDHEVFWLVEPGVAVYARMDAPRSGADDLRVLAGGIRATRPKSPRGTPDH